METGQTNYVEKLKTKKIFSSTIYILFLITAIANIFGELLIDAGTNLSIMYRTDIFYGSILWLGVLVLRIVPLILFSIGIIIISSKASRSGEISRAGINLIIAALVIFTVYVIMIIISGSIIVKRETNNMVTFPENEIYIMSNMVIVYLILIGGLKAVTYVFTIIYLHNYKSSNKEKFSLLAPIMLFVTGGMIIANLVPICRMYASINSVVDDYFLISFRYSIHGYFLFTQAILMIVFGIIILVLRKSKKID